MALSGTYVRAAFSFGSFRNMLRFGNNLIAETSVHHILSSFRNLDYFEFISELGL